MSETTVIYHKSCADGFCAAWLFHRVLPGVEYIPAQYGDDPPEIKPGSEVYIVDFSYPRDVLLRIADENDLVVLDHHKTAQANCAGLPFAQFDMDRCGARMAYDYLVDKKAMLPDSDIEKVVNYVQDRDLWKWELPESREINAAISSYPFDFEVWDTFPGVLDTFTPEGRAILRYHDQLIASHVRNAHEFVFGGHLILGVNCSAGKLISDVAGELAVGKPFGVCWFDTGDGFRVFSLRSKPEGVDVSDIAKKFGGGGHKHAAGFRVSQDQGFSIVRGE